MAACTEFLYIHTSSSQQLRNPVNVCASDRSEEFLQCRSIPSNRLELTQVNCKPLSWQDLNRQTDEQLAVFFLAGEQDALAVLFDRYHRLVFSVAVRILSDAGEAEEVVQTVFLDICRAMANFDSRKGTLKVWLMQYAYHRALHRKRHLDANRFYSWVELEDVHEEFFSPPVIDMLERMQFLNTLLERTTAQRRMILELTYCEGLTANEVAIQTGLSVNVVRHEIYRALDELRKLTSSEGAKVPSRTLSFQPRESNAPSI